MPNAFTRKKLYTAIAREFDAVLIEPKLDGAGWTAYVQYRKEFNEGQKFVYRYATKDAMTKDLQSRSKRAVEFRVKTVDKEDFDSEVKAAKENMLETAPRRNEALKKPKQPEAPRTLESQLQAIGYSETEAGAICLGFYKTAVVERPEYLDNFQNQEIVYRYMLDKGMAPTLENFGTAIDALIVGNFLIRRTRVRGSAPIHTYVSPAAVPPEVDELERAKHMSLEELRSLERKRQAENRKKRPIEERAIGTKFWQ
jgi:hypothetical protein